MVEAMIFMLRCSCPWRDLPEVFGPWSSVYTRWSRCRRCRRPAAAFGFIAHQSPSGRRQSRWKPAKSGFWTNQGRAEHESHRPGGRKGASRSVDRRTWKPQRHGCRRRDRCASREDRGGGQRYDSDALRERITLAASRACIPLRARRRAPAKFTEGSIASVIGSKTSSSELSACAELERVMTSWTSQASSKGAPG